MYQRERVTKGGIESTINKCMFLQMDWSINELLHRCLHNVTKYNKQYALVWIKQKISNIKPIIFTR